MTEDPSTRVMEILKSCRCCLQRVPHRDLTTPYTHLNKTETYADMLKACFNIQLPLVNKCGICEVCISRLQDAKEFKLQVQRSQTELQMQLERALQALEKTSVQSKKAESGMGNDFVILISDDELSVKSVSDDAASDDGLTSVTWDYAAPATPDLAEPELTEVIQAREQLAMTCRVRLERLRPDNLPHQCRICHQAFHREAGLTTHMRLHTEISKEHDAKRVRNHKLICDNCGKQFTSKTRLIRHIRAETCVECKICSKKFTTRQSLIFHQLIHACVKQYTCKVCNKQFRQNKMLKYHQIHTHTVHTVEEKQTKCDSTGRNSNGKFICDICYMKFDRKRWLIKHLRAQTCVKCKICSENFPDIQSLTLHQSVHTRDNPYVCIVCNKQFRLNSSLYYHQIHAHTVELPVSSKNSFERSQEQYDRRFTCDICSKHFDLKQLLTSHIQENKCTSYNCSKTFTATHSEHELPEKGTYVCGVCDKRFKLQYHLDVHKCLQKGVKKPYACDSCPKKFFYRSEFDKHINPFGAKRSYGRPSNKRIQIGRPNKHTNLKQTATKQQVNLSQHLQSDTVLLNYINYKDGTHDCGLFTNN